MTALLESKRDAIAKACAQHGVASLCAFGSVLRNDFQPGVSDIDLLVEFAPMEAHARVEAYFGLLEELRSLLGVEVDLVMTGAVKNRFIAAAIEQSKVGLYAA